MDLAEALDSISREILWAVLYESGIPWITTGQLKIGLAATRLCLKYKGPWGNTFKITTGYFRDAPLSQRYLSYTSRL